MASVPIKFTADTRDFDRGVSSMSGSIAGLGSLIAGIGIASLGVNAARDFTSLAVSASTAAANVETLGVQFEVLLGSANKAKSFVADLKQIADKTPFELSQLSEASRKLIAFGMDANYAKVAMKQLGDISAGDNTKFQSLADAFGKTFAKGFLDNETANRFTDAGFDILGAIAKKKGITRGESFELASDKGISSKDAIDALSEATSEGGRFYQMMEKVSQTTTGKLSTLSDTWTSLKVAMGSGINTGLKDDLDALNTSLPQLEGAFTSVGSEVGGILTGLSKVIPDVVSKLNDIFTQESPLAASIKVIGQLLMKVVNDSGVIDSFKQLGRYIAQGAVDGFKSLLSNKTVTDGVKGAGAAAVASMIPGVSFGRIPSAILAAEGGDIGKNFSNAASFVTGNNNVSTIDGLIGVGTIAALGLTIKSFISLGGSILSLTGGIGSLSTVTAGLGGALSGFGVALGQFTVILGGLAVAGKMLYDTLKMVVDMKVTRASAEGDRTQIRKAISDQLNAVGLDGNDNYYIDQMMQPGNNKIKQMYNEELRLQLEKNAWQEKENEAIKVRAENQSKQDAWFEQQADIKRKQQEVTDMLFKDMTPETENFFDSLPNQDTKKTKTISQNIGVAKPFLTSLASIGGAKFFTQGYTMVDQQRITNDILRKIEAGISKMNPDANVKTTMTWT